MSTCASSRSGRRYRGPRRLVGIAMYLSSFLRSTRRHQTSVFVPCSFHSLCSRALLPFLLLISLFSLRVLDDRVSKRVDTRTLTLFLLNSRCPTGWQQRYTRRLSQKLRPSTQRSSPVGTQSHLSHVILTDVRTATPASQAIVTSLPLSCS